MKYQLIEHKQSVKLNKTRNIAKGITYVYKAYGIDNGDIKTIKTFDEKEEALQELKKYKTNIDKWGIYGYADFTEYYIIEYDEVKEVTLNPVAFSEITFGLIKRRTKDIVATFESLEDMNDFLREDLKERYGSFNERELTKDFYYALNCEKHPENHYEENWKWKRASKNEE